MQQEDKHKSWRLDKTTFKSVKFKQELNAKIQMTSTKLNPNSLECLDQKGVKKIWKIMLESRKYV